MSAAAAGAVVGSAVGDALGAHYEALFPAPDEPIAMRSGGGHFPGRKLGAWTDDTSMALGVLDALAAGTVDPLAVAGNFLAWHAGGPAEIGAWTHTVLKSADGQPDVLAAAAEAWQRRMPESAGNGALMRTAPVALAAPGDRAETARLAAEIAALTHPHPDSVDACVLWSLAIQQAITCARPGLDFDWLSGVRAGLTHLADARRRRRWEGLIDEVARTRELFGADCDAAACRGRSSGACLGRGGAAGARCRFTPNGWVVTAFQAALWAVSRTPEPPQDPAGHFRRALIAAVRVGDDTDTVAAIAGGLLGARWGLSAIPAEWRGVIHGERRRGLSVSGDELVALAGRALAFGLRFGNGDEREHRDGARPG